MGNINTKDYSNFVSSIELVNLYLNSYTANFYDDNVATELKLEISGKHSHKHVGKFITINNENIISAKGADNEVISIAATYVLKYQIDENLEVNDEFINKFVETSVSLTIWPYFRELVNSTVSKMGLPPLILPLIKM